MKPPQSTIQVGSGYYAKGSYNTLERFVSYFYQVSSLDKLNISTLLEIGVGNKLTTEVLRSYGIIVTTCDFDKETAPDIVADVRAIPVPDKSYDAVSAFQILEHIPFEDFPKVLGELKRVARRHVVISLPYRSTFFEAAIKFPGIRTLLKKPILDLFVRIPLRFAGYESSGQHHWEIDRSRYSIRKVRAELAKIFNIIEEFSPELNKFHYFFILEVK